MVVSRLGGAVTRRWVVAVLVATAAGCASTPAPLPSSSLVPSGGAFHGVRRLVVVPSGQSRFVGVRTDDEAQEAFDRIFAWAPHRRVLISIARAVYEGVTWLMQGEGGGAPRGVDPQVVVTAAFTQALRRSGPFDTIVAVEREPVGDRRPETDVVVRVSVPSWGLVRVQGGESPLVSGFADVRARMVRPETGVALWEHEEDVTHPDRRSLDALVRDRALARASVVGALERAGHRLASELVYAQGRAP